jgi:succinyldiaminopimelate transaminase
LRPFADVADAHPGGRIDLSIGTPVDPTPTVVQDALTAAADAPGYPTTAGTPELRDACAQWLKRRHGVHVSADAVLPVIGSKEFIAQLPNLLGLGPTHVVAVPEIAYPTYAVGATFAGCNVRVGKGPADLTWLNSPSNPTGEVLSVAEMRDAVAQSRAASGVLVSDECYIELGWDVTPISVLHPDVVGSDHRGILALHSLSKRSNMAGYRFGFVTGDRELIGQLLEVRKHLGGMVPLPVQAAAIAAWRDDVHVETQRKRYLARRNALLPALIDAGFQHNGAAAGLYLWVTRGEPCWETVAWFADRGILVAPGDFYGDSGGQHVRIALTASEEHVNTAVSRIAAAS